MNNEYLTLKLTENKLIKIWYDEASIFYDDLFHDSVSLIANDENSYIRRNYSSKGQLSHFRVKNFIQENDDETEFYFHWDELKNYAFYSVYHSGDEIKIDSRIHKNDTLSYSDYENISFILAFNIEERGLNIDDEKAIDEAVKSWVNCYNSLVNGQCYGFTLYELEKCNLGHVHENEIDSWGGFYGYENDSSMILSMLDHCIDKKEITYFDDLKNNLSQNDFLKIKLLDLVG